MTVTTSESTANFYGNGVTIQWPIPFGFFTDADLVVTLIEDSGVTTNLALNVDYSVQGAGSPGNGHVTTFAAAPSLSRLNVERVLDAVQLVDIRNQGAFFPEVHEGVFDRLTMLLQQVKREAFKRIGETPKYQNIGVYGAGLEFTSYNQTFAYASEFYAPRAVLALPYTTTGAGAGEIASFRSVGDALLRQDLAGDPAAGLGVALVNGASKEADIIKISAPNNTSSGIAYANYNDYIGVLAGKMKAGDEVSIACFGDSTTDGNGTSGFTQNPISGNSAIGNSNHNLTAPNAWPNRLQTLLRDIYQNTNIKTYNAGYTNQKMEDGWANDNYQAAVIDNPFYGVPDILFIQFGVNDSVGAGSQLAEFINQYRIFLRRVIDDGTAPVIMTTDAGWSKLGDAFNRPAIEIQRELNSALKSLANEFGIPLVDMYKEERNWLQNNTDGYKWMKVQQDTLHLNDDGHSFKSQIIAMQFFNDAAIFDGGVMWINSQSSQCASLGTREDLFESANNKQGGSYAIYSPLPTGTTIMKLWVWSLVPDAQLIYLGISTEGIGATTLPGISVTNIVDNQTITKFIDSARYTYSPGNGHSDIPYIHGKLHYGLNKVIYLSSDASTSFFGGFKLTEARQAGTNCLIESGRVLRRYADDSGEHLEILPEARNLCNTSSSWDGEATTIQIKATIPKGSGVVLLSGPGFRGSIPVEEAIILYRPSETQMQIIQVSISEDGTLSSGANTLEETIAGLTDNFDGQVDILNDAGVQKVNLTVNGTLVQSNVIDGSIIRQGGICGGIYVNTAASVAGEAFVELSDMTLVR